MKGQYYQGDVGLIPIAPPTTTGAVILPDPDGLTILARGEVTGHRHAVHGRATLFMDTGAGSGGRLFHVAEPAELRHEEHGTIPLEAGWYRIISQREWTDAEEPSHVTD